MTVAALDPLAPAPRGMWSAPGVRVRRRVGRHRPHTGACTARFCARRRAGLLMVEHDLTPDELCDELAVMLAEQLVDTGALHGQSEFELVFTGIVRSTVDGGLPAWLRFYRNSLARLETGQASFAPVHQRAEELVRGNRLIDLGSCFGFFPMRMALRGIDVTATDLSAPTMDLVATASARLFRPVRTIACDATRVPLPDRYADTVTALHLVEHLSPAATDAVIDEAIRLARRRVVIAVPFEDEARACYGHIQRFDIEILQRHAERIWKQHPGVSVTIDEFHGGWLILNR